MAISNPMGTPPSGAASLPLILKDESLGGSAAASKTATPFEHSLPLKPVDTNVSGDPGASKIQTPFENSLKNPK